MRKIIFSFIRWSANRKWRKAVCAKTAQEAVQRTIKVLTHGGDPNFVMGKAEYRGTPLDRMPVGYVEAILHIRRAGGRTLSELEQIDAEAKELAAVRTAEYNQRQDDLRSATEAHKSAVLSLNEAEEAEKEAQILSDAMKWFR